MTKILVAEDERDIRDLIGFTLRFAGFEVVTYPDGAEALVVGQRRGVHRPHRRAHEQRRGHRGARHLLPRTVEHRAGHLAVERRRLQRQRLTLRLARRT